MTYFSSIPQLLFMKKAVKVVMKSAFLSTVCVLLFTTAVLAAAILISIPSDINIVPGEVTAEVFLDPEATIPVTAVHWGDVGRGTHQQFVFYVKNTGVEDIAASMSIPEDVSAFMTYSFTPASVALCSGEVGQITFEADILPTAVLGIKNWTYQVGTP